MSLTIKHRISTKVNHILGHKARHTHKEYTPDHTKYKEQKITKSIKERCHDNPQVYGNCRTYF